MEAPESTGSGRLMWLRTAVKDCFRSIPVGRRTDENCLGRRPRTDQVGAVFTREGHVAQILAAGAGEGGVAIWNSQYGKHGRRLLDVPVLIHDGDISSQAVFQGIGQSISIVVIAVTSDTGE